MSERVNKELNEFELELISGGGSASFPPYMVATRGQMEKLMDATGATEETIRKCLELDGQVEVKPEAKPEIPFKFGTPIYPRFPMVVAK